MFKAVLFDLDGTLLHMDEAMFIKIYFSNLGQKLSNLADSELVLKGLIAGTKAMTANDGTMSNEERFWNVFETVTKLNKTELEDILNDFYLHEFSETKKATTINPAAAALVAFFKKKGLRIIAATNPLFPAIATRQRLAWAGLDDNDFELITTYENSSFCKPSLDYYKSILNTLDLTAEECIMIGNDVKEDGCVEALNIPCYITTDNLKNSENEEIKCTWHGPFEELLPLFEKSLTE